MQAIAVILCNSNNCNVPQEDVKCIRIMRSSGYLIKVSSEGVATAFKNCQEGMVSTLTDQLSKCRLLVARQAQLYTGC